MIEKTHRLLQTNYGIDVPVVSKIEVPSHNYIYKAEGGQASYVVKIYSGADFTPLKPGYQAEHIDYESEILERLENCGTPVIPLVRDINGRSIHNIGSHRAIVFRYVEGRPFNNSLEQIARSAEALAKVHQCLPEDALATRAFDYETFADRWIRWLPMQRKNPRFGECIPDPAGFDLAAKQVATWLGQASTWQNLIWVHGHGDMHPRNFLFQGDIPFMFDFQAARLMPRLADLADGMIEFGIFNGAWVPERMECFLSHYEALFPLTEVERNRMTEFLRADAVVKVLSTLEAELAHGYRVDAGRMKALLDFCLK